jgi:hypothetical protein
MRNKPLGAGCCRWVMSWGFRLARLAGFEPATDCLEGRVHAFGIVFDVAAYSHVRPTGDRKRPDGCHAWCYRQIGRWSEAWAHSRSTWTLAACHNGLCT